MKEDYLMIHYGELSTKGDNKKLFIACLLRNIKHTLADSALSYQSTRDHIYISLAGEDPHPLIAKLEEVSGIQKISLVYKSEKNLSSLLTDSLALALQEPGKTFKIDAQRSDKHFELDSYHICVAVADNILDRSSLKVDIHHPDITIVVNVREDAIFLSAHSFPGAGGYPLGMNGKAMLLISGGIDSPVACYSLLRRGIKVEGIHFASPPYTNAAVIDKLTDILKIMANYQDSIRLNVIRFTALQEAIYKNVEEPYCITIMRRMMLRIAVGLAQKNHCLCLATGESIGQVASQTLDSLLAINAVTNFPILRPLCTEDKLTIIAQAKKIGTFDISIRPYEDCCTIFAPKKPKTKPKIYECEFYEGKFDWAPLVKECIATAQTVYVGKNGVKASEVE